MKNKMYLPRFIKASEPVHQESFWVCYFINALNYKISVSL